MDTALEAVLVDMDGTLLDSEKVWDVALADLARSLGGQLSASARERMIGSSLDRSVSIMHESLEVDGDRRHSADYLLERAHELFRTDLVWKPGAQRLLTDLRAAGVPVALVTSTQRRLTELALDVLDRALFSATVCGDEVEHPKPHPDPYLRAAALVGADPARCVAIEDSPLGVESAESAGCVVLAVPSEVALHPRPGTVVLETLTGLTPGALARLVDGRA